MVFLLLEPRALLPDTLMLPDTVLTTVPCGRSVVYPGWYRRCTMVGGILPGTMVGGILPGTMVGISHPMHPGGYLSPYAPRWVCRPCTMVGM